MILNHWNGALVSVLNQEDGENDSKRTQDDYAYNMYRGDGEFDTYIYKAGKQMSKAVMI